MNQHADEHVNQAEPLTAKPRQTRRWLVIAAVSAAVGASGFAGASFASEAKAGLPGMAELHGMGGMHGMQGKRGGRHGAMDPAKMEQHLVKMIERIVPDATAQQKSRLLDIGKQAFAELQPMHKELKEGKKRAHDLLLQPQVDRRALEVLRVEQMQKMDAISKRMLRAAADAAETLTPEQRQRFDEHMKKRSQRRSR